MKSILISEERWQQIVASTVEARGNKYRLSFVLKRDLGWSGRRHPNNQRKVYIDFWSEDAKTMFLLEFGLEGIVKEPQKIINVG